MRVYFSKPNIPELAKEHMLVDMHFHSSASPDSSTKVQAILKRCKELGVHVALTDHNAIDSVLAAHRMSPGTIKPGIEICTMEGKDVIPYFYDINELQEFYKRTVEPRLRKKTSLQSNATRLPMAELMDDLKRCNCVITLPHPFALPPRRSYTLFRKPAYRPLLRHIHAIEVINQTMMHKQNLAAIGWAMQFDKAIVGGSDGHVIKPLGSAFTLSPANSWEEFLDNIREKRVAVIGEERKLRHHMIAATNLLREKANIIKNFRGLKVDEYDE